MDKSEMARRPPAPGEGKRGEQGYLGYLLRQGAATQRLKMERALVDLAVTPPQFAVLTMLMAYPGLSNAELARLSLLTPQTASVIVANLLKRRALSRRPHAVHGRILKIEVTPAGRKLLARCRERVQVVERDLAQSLSRQEEKTVRRWLAGLARDAAAAS